MSVLTRPDPDMRSRSVAALCRLHRQREGELLPPHILQISMGHRLLRRSRPPVTIALFRYTTYR